jgi:surface carbohydrate biosynthesis protein (TIGR04326 family)
MMRPWDLRARTFLREYPVSQLAVHGRHDHTELEILGTPLVEVEALRYQHLAVPSSRPATRGASDEPTWLVVGGGDCERSAAELHELLKAMHQSAVERRVVARWHPQCTAPTDVTLGNVRFTTEPLHELVKHADAAFMVGRAGPLDTYLAGVPSCSLRDESGLAMSPIDENPLHHTATDADDAVNWMLAAEQQQGFTASTEDYFVIDEQLPRWMALVKKLMS